MLKKSEVDLIISDARVYYSFLDGYRLKAFCRHALDTRVKIVDIPLRKVHVMDLPYDGVICFGFFGHIKKFFVTPGFFKHIYFERRK